MQDHDIAVLSTRRYKQFPFCPFCRGQDKLKNKKINFVASSTRVSLKQCQNKECGKLILLVTTPKIFLIRPAFLKLSRREVNT